MPTEINELEKKSKDNQENQEPGFEKNNKVGKLQARLIKKNETRCK